MRATRVTGFIWIIAVLFFVQCKEAPRADLTIFAGAGLMKPMNECIKEFENRENISIRTHYGSSGEIFGMVAAGQYCDILIPGAEKYTEDALKNGWVVKESIQKLVLHIPTIVVPKGNPANIRKLEDLARPGVKVALGDPKGPAIGRVTRKLLMKNRLWDKIQKNVTVMGPTVNQLLIYPALRQVDAAIVWKDITAWAEDREKVESIAIEKKKNIIKTIPTAITTKSSSPETAKKFNAFLASEEGMRIWKKWGFIEWAK